MATGIGQRIRRREDPRFLLGRGRYVDDTRIENALHVTFVRSSVAHGDDHRDRRRRGARAAGRPGLHRGRPRAASRARPRRCCRCTRACSGRRWPPTRCATSARSWPRSWPRRGKRRSTPPSSSPVDYDPLPAVTDIREVVKDEVLLFEPSGSNTCLRIPGAGDANLFDGCDVVVTGSNESPRLLALPIEPRSTVAEFEDGKLTIWLSTQTPHQDKAGIAATSGLEPEQVRVIAPDVGGGFGGKGFDVEDILMGALARATDRPVRWTETRSEHMVAMHHGRAQWADFELGGTSDGTFKALRVKLLQDAGRLPRHRRVPGRADPDDVQRRLRHPQDRGRRHLGRLQLDPDRARARRRAPRGDADDRAGGRHVRRRDRHGPRRAAPAQLHRQREVPHRDRRRRPLRHRRLRRGAGSSARAGRLRASCAASRCSAAPTAPAPCWGSASPSTSRSPTASRRASSAPSRSPRTAGRSSAPARSHTARATRRPSPRSWPSAPESTWRRSRSWPATPTASRAAPAPTAPSRPRSAAPPPARRPRCSSTAPSSSPPTRWRPTRRTWCSTWNAAASTSPGPRSRRWAGRSWPSAWRRTVAWPS